MTGSEMILSFDQYYDKIANLAAPGYLEAEKLRFLNNAQMEFVKERTFGKNFQPPAFDDNQKRVADIRPLVAYGQWATSVVTTYGNSVSVDHYAEDSSYMFLMKLDVRIIRTNPTITNIYVPGKEIDLDTAEKFKETAFNRPWFKNPVFLNVRDTGIYVIGDYYTTSMDYVRVNYVRRPVTITAALADFTGIYGSGMSLEPHTHQEIVDIAVRHAVATSGDTRYQVKMAEQQVKTE